MSENYFDLSDHEKREILQAASHHFTKSEIILEKDIWICLIRATNCKDSKDTTPA